ncbi:MAG: TolB family protein, partial [Anaerolineae bacterium]
MPQPKIAPYGSWASPITSDLIVSATIRLGSAHVEGDDRHGTRVYWLEGRPSEGGRNVLVRRDPESHVTDLLPPPFNARTRVHEYGGGAVVVHDGVVYFSNYSDQRLYRLVPDEDPVPMTPELPLRYADGVVDAARDRIICIREDHRDEAKKANDGQPVNAIVAVSLADGAQQEILVGGNDFYASPRLSPDGQRLAWLTWNHPNMPWDGTELWLAELDAGGACIAPRRVAGGLEESIFAPSWSPDGVLTFVSDRTGWWNLYRWQEDEAGGGHARCLVEMEAEFGQPQWAFGMSTYTYISSREIVCAYGQEGTDHLAHLDVQRGTLTPIETGYTSISGVVGDAAVVVFRGGAPTKPTALVALDPGTGAHYVLKRSAEVDVDIGYLSMPEPITYPSASLGSEPTEG